MLVKYVLPTIFIVSHFHSLLGVKGFTFHTKTYRIFRKPHNTPFIYLSINGI